MKERSFDEMIAYFNRKVSEMDIAQDYKMELLGMVTALGYKHEKSSQSERKMGKWEHLNRCSECGFGVLLSPYMHNLDTGEYTLLYKFCPNCGAKMEDEP